MDWTTGVQFQGEVARDVIPLSYHVQTSSMAHPASYTVFTRNKVARA